MLEERKIRLNICRKCGEELEFSGKKLIYFESDIPEGTDYKKGEWAAEYRCKNKKCNARYFKRQLHEQGQHASVVVFSA